MTTTIGGRAWRAMRRAASAIRKAHDEQVFMGMLLAQQQGGAAGHDRPAQLGSLT
jgi:hypothetical protein